jgi:hypothetical protein
MLLDAGKHGLAEDDISSFENRRQLGDGSDSRRTATRWKFPFTFSLKKFYLLEPHLACDQVPARLDVEPVWNP